MKNNFCVIIILPLFLFSQVLAASDPTVIEESVDYHGGSDISYTVINPADSGIGAIVGFVIEVAYTDYLYARTTNGWMAQGLTPSPLDTVAWELNMSDNDLGTYALTWREFYRGIDYPFGGNKGVGFFVNYSEIESNTFQFDWSYSNAPYHLPILAGETRDGFHSLVDLTPASEYLLAYIDDAQNGTFSDNGLSAFRGQTPEPATLVLFGLGGLSLLRKRRA
jgi:hypothetical protein